MKDLITRDNINQIRYTLSLLYPKYRFVVGARYDPINFTFVFIIKVIEKDEDSYTAFPITVYVDDLYTDISETLHSIIDEAINMLKKVGY